MSRIASEFSVIPRTAWIVAIAVYVLAAGLGLPYIIETSPDSQRWPLWGKILFSSAVPIPLTAFILLVGYVNGDARRRGMRHVLWTLLAIFVPNLIGVILYFILREPLIVRCPECGRQLRANFPFCPHCGTRLGLVCPRCQRPAEPAWLNCAFCGQRLPS